MAQTDSTQEAGTQVANPAVSANADQPNSFNPEEFAKTLKAQILADLQDPRHIQSQKDKVIAEIKKDKGMREYFAEFKKMQEEGLSDADIQRELRIRELEARVISEPVTPIQPAGRVIEPAANDAVMAVLPALGLDQNDPEVTSALLQGSIVDKMGALVALSTKKKSQPNPASVAQPSGGAAPQSNLMDDYKKASANVRGNALIELKMEYRRRGLDIS